MGQSQMPPRSWVVRNSNLFIQQDHTRTKLMATLTLSKFSCARMEAFYRVKIMNELVIAELGNDNGGFLHNTKDNVQMHLFKQK